MNKIECFGEMCPIPLLKAKKKYEQIEINETFLLVTDHSCVLQSISDYFHKTHTSIEIEEVMTGVWEIQITKIA
jgi:TusA-related sulfurtransferase